MKDKISLNTIFSNRILKMILSVTIIATIVTTTQPYPASSAKRSTSAFRPKTRVQKLKKTRVTTHSVRLNWRKFKGASGYQIFRSTSKKGGFHKVASSKKNFRTDKKLFSGKKYFYKVRAYKKIKNKRIKYSRFSATLMIKTKNNSDSSIPAPTAPVAPTGSTPTINPPAATTPTLQVLTTDTPNTMPPMTEQPATNMPPTVTPGQHIQNLNYQESTDKMNNPDQGFYRPIYVCVKEDGVTYNKNIINNSTQLYHLRIDISAFSQANNQSEDIRLTEAALSGIDELLSFLYDNNKSAIARFVYDPGLNGASNKEPARDMIVQHITQLSAILDNYHDTITAIEVGLIGPWGEMHTSTMANKEVINTLIDTYLGSTTQLPVLVRTPKMIYDYLGITVNEIDTYTIEASSKAYRLGLYNDGYLGSSTDLGTYTNREKEVPWLAYQTGHLPYGGEVVVPDSTMHNIENCLEEMNQLHLSYLNIEWNNVVIEKWKNSFYTEAVGKNSLYYGKTAFEYIENHMGYRFVLQNATLEYDDERTYVNIDLSLKNVGFGNLNKAMKMSVLFQDETGEVTSIDAGSFHGEEKISFWTPVNLKQGNYQVYLKLDKGNDKYAVQFANDLWNEELHANCIGSIPR